jgi:BolA protein
LISFQRYYYVVCLESVSGRTHNVGYQKEGNMQLAHFIDQRLHEIFQPVHREVLNESHGHSVAPGSETHFKVIVVADTFAGRNQVQRHRLVYGALAEALERGVHALAIHTYTPEEWAVRNGTPASPPCLGGSKHDKR